MRIRLRHGPVWYALRAAVAGVLALGTAGLVAITSASASPASPASGHCKGNPTIKKDNFGTATDTPYSSTPETVWRYTLTNCHGMQVRYLTYGAITQSIKVPDRHGHLADVVLGFKTLDEYVTEDSPPSGGPYFGETIGRYGNRIAKGTFELNGQTYTLPINNGVNSLHGGFVGFGNHIWRDATIRHGHGSVSLTLKLVSPNGDEGSGLLPGTNSYEPSCDCTGYPAKLTVWVTFTLDNHNRIWIHYRAHNDSPDLATVLNLTNHSYFNLAGEASGVTYDQKVMMNADYFNTTDPTQIPNGTVAVKGTPFDFRHFHTIGSRISDASAPYGNQLVLAHGYDHNWILNKTGPKLAGLNLAAKARDSRSGRELTVWTDQPGVQFYSGNYLDGSLVGISGHTYRQSAGYTFETQHFPDSPNQPQFPSTVLTAGNTFNSTTVFAFSH